VIFHRSLVRIFVIATCVTGKYSFLIEKNRSSPGMTAHRSSFGISQREIFIPHREIIIPHREIIIRHRDYSFVTAK